MFLVSSCSCLRSIHWSQVLSWFSPVRFLARKAEWSACKNFTLVLFSWSHQSTGRVWLDTAVHLWFDRIIRYRTRTGPVRDLQGCCCTAFLRTRKGFYASRIFENRCCICPYGALMSPSRSPHGLFTGCLRSLNPHGARELIMHALKLYGPRTGRRNRTMPHGARAGPVSGRRFLFKTAAREKPVRSPECDATEALDVVEDHTSFKGFSCLFSHRSHIYRFLPEETKCVFPKYW